MRKRFLGFLKEEYMKKFIKVLLVSLVVLSLTACGANKDKDKEGETGQTYNLKVWGSQEDQALLGELVEEFKALDPDNTYNIEIAVVGEPDALDQVTGDIETAADVFAFPNDQLRDFVAAGALYEITLNKDKIISEQMEGAIDSATLDGALYGIPFTADNGYFLYYDSNFFSADDVKSLESMLAKAEAEGKQVFMDVSNGWYIASFFLGAGNTIKIEDGKQVVDFNNDRGVAVGEFIAEFVSSSAFLTGDDAVMTSAAKDGKVKAAVSGVWTAADFEEAFGDGYAATKLPTFNINGEDVQMGSFGGYKLYGVKSQTKHPEQAMALAEFLANEENQVRRYEVRSYGPSNLKAAANEKVQENVALRGFSEQSVYAHPQNDVLGSYWSPAEAFGTELESGNTSNIKALLDEMVAQIMQ